MYRWIVYYISPLTRWNPQAYPSEIIAEGRAPWKWLARAGLLSLYQQLDPNRCAYVLLRGDIEIEVCRPPLDGATMPA
jgi:hypothetical protein